MMKHDSESDSNASASQLYRGPSDACYRVKVCMKQYFRDERAHVYVCVRARDRVRWLRRRLRTLFPLPPHFVLLSRGLLLPPDEPLAVLRQDDTVDVVPSRVDFGAAADSVMADDDYVGSHALAAAPESEVEDSAAETPARAARDSPDSGTSASGLGQNLEQDDDDVLRQSKCQALLVLEQYCGEQPTKRVRRRRVRRRRRAAGGPAGSGAVPAGSVAVPAGSGAVPAGSGAAVAAGERAGTAAALRNGYERSRAASVLRNGSERSRQPRVIRPLDVNGDL